MTMTNERHLYPSSPLSDAELGMVRQLAARHDAGRTALLGVDRDRYPAQGAFRLDGQTLGPKYIYGLANQLEPRFDKVIGSLEGQPQISRMGELLDKKQNVAIALPHGPLTDIGIASAAIKLKLQEQGHKFKTGILVSQTLQMLALKFNDAEVPAADALGFLCDYVYFSVPRTKHVEESDLGEDSVGMHNKTMIKDLRQRLDEGGLLLMVAPSGTTDKVHNGNHNLAPLTPGTISLMRHNNLFVQPLATKLADTEPFVFELAGEPRRIKTSSEAHNVMQELATAMSAHLPDSNYIYQDPR